ncbi:rCG59212 [Rattus norvegicus]|uniref:RCG59212 n=1 Tax=Rattus norvegicus TaxID=10116 RepID=A6K7V1_RAT|nr:rCG59212 [Rattus norvegicus]
MPRNTGFLKLGYFQLKPKEFEPQEFIVT